MAKGKHYYLYYGIKANHEEAQKIENFFIQLDQNKKNQAEKECFFLREDNEDENEEFALEISFENCGLEDVDLAGQYANSMIQNLSGYIENHQDEVPYYIFGIRISERKNKLSSKEKQEKENKIFEKWKKLLPYLAELNLKKEPHYTIIEQTI